MSNGFGAAFFALALLAVLAGVAGLLVVTTVLVLRRGRQVPGAIQRVAAGLVGIVVVVGGFGIALLADEAPPLAALLAVVVVLPLVAVGVRARLSGYPWIAMVAAAGLAWSPPFLVSVGLLFVLQVATGLSPAVMTGLAAVVATGGALLVGELIDGVLFAGARRHDHRSRTH
ncbi:MAG: hypothetical protein ABEH66_04965 [Halobacteriales archaeon]